jgi:hypothetical protein
MANLPELVQYDAGVYQIETSDPVLGGPSGVTNAPLKNLTNRTAFLKSRVDMLEAGTTVPPGIATQNYVQAELMKLAFKDPVRAVTSANITLSGAQTIDGVAVVAGDRVLVRSQSTPSQNGIYVASASAWARSEDMNADSEIRAGVAVMVTAGTTYADTLWRLTTDGAISIGSTALTFTCLTENTALLGNPTAPTAAQFDADTSLATTEFVQRALGNSRGFVGLTANTTLSAAHAGMDIYASTTGAAITLTLPAANALPAGARFNIINTGVNDVIVQRAGSDTIVLNNTTNAVTSVTLRAGDSIVLNSLGTGALWYHGGGTAQFGRAGAFGSSLGSSGWQRLPSGLIVQWGVFTGQSTTSFPISFPTACNSVVGSVSASGGPISFFISQSVTASNFYARVIRSTDGSTVADGGLYVATGY